ncbi:MAG: dihydroorotase [Chloroflexota bacterium]|nr:dihydroorotase [Chloroflexota bacterium]
MQRERVLLRGGRVVDPANQVDRITDVLIADGRIADIGPALDSTGARVVPADGRVVAPGLIDVHVHLREPGDETKETIATGTAAAAAGGFTSIFCMPNTRPALDSVATLEDLRQRITVSALVRVFPIAAITAGRRGQRAVDFSALVEAGAVGFSDDGDTTADSAIMRQALAATQNHGRPVMVHCEDKSLAPGSMHEGDVSRRLGLRGIPAAAEEIIIARDLMLAGLTGGWLHICHLSTGRGAELVRRAKADGVRVTAEVMPHHLLMSDEWVDTSRSLLNVDEPTGPAATPRDPHTKVNPPLRTNEDTRQLIAAVVDGTIDLVATDHAPHGAAEKTGSGYDEATFGLSGLELALPLMLALVRAGHLTLGDVIARMSRVPAKLWSLDAGTLTPGAPADVVVFDPDERWIVDAAKLKTKSANTPLIGMELRGRVKHTFVGGVERYGT